MAKEELGFWHSQGRRLLLVGPLWPSAHPYAGPVQLIVVYYDKVSCGCCGGCETLMGRAPFRWEAWCEECCVCQSWHANGCRIPNVANARAPCLRVLLFGPWLRIVQSGVSRSAVEGGGREGGAIDSPAFHRHAHVHTFIQTWTVSKECVLFGRAGGMCLCVCVWVDR